MARYIDADAVVSKLDNLVEEYVKHDCIQSSLAAGVLADFRDTELNEIPFADVVEVKHGEWEICCDGYYPYCSECGYEPPWVKGKDMRTKHCPECGAKMNGKENSNEG